ncbi:hypothetical protein RhiirA4_520401 [Rhizophagus irregularis]|uniref:Uncharacterized protein n=1 Tax=Rhizophagus irregularis TaxID=588596 RepID=A0A2I1GJA7_9GLOM|nr:hypothetical protein RhiirA4_520401 [Rhizophagus irregularis]
MVDTSQIIEQGLIHELIQNQCEVSCQNGSTLLNNEINKSCIQDMENLTPGSAEGLSYLFDKAVKKGQEEILCWYYYSLEFENRIKVNTLAKSLTSCPSASEAQAEAQVRQGLDPAKTLDEYPNLYREFSSENFDYYGITNEKLCPLCKLEHGDEESIEGNIKSDKILTPEYLDWHAKLSGLPSILTDKIHSNLCKRYKKETGNEPWQASRVVTILTPEYLDWHAKLSGLPSILTDKIQSSLYKKYKKETGHEPWQLSEVHESEVINSKPENKISDLSFPSSSEQCEEKGPITFEVKSDSELIIKSVLEHFTYLKFRNSFRGIDNYNFASPQPWSSPCLICNGKHGNYRLYGSWYRENGNQFPYDPELAKLYSQDNLEYCLTCNTSSKNLKFAIIA